MTTDNVRILKTGTCPSLSGKSKLTYEIGAGPASEVCVRVTKNTGAGMFSKAWVALDQVHKLVNDKPITSTTLAPLFKGGSANSAGIQPISPTKIWEMMKLMTGAFRDANPGSRYEWPDRDGDRSRYL